MNTELATKPLQNKNEPPTNERILPTRYARFGAFHLDLQRQELFRSGTRLRVPGKVYQVLATLLECPGEIVNREALRERLWPANTHVNFEANVNTTINKLRQVLGDSNDQSIYVQTIPRRGYSFVAKVEFLEKVTTRPAPGEAGEQRLASPTGKADSRFSDSRIGNVWFTAGVIALVVAAILFGATITLYLHQTL